MKRIIFMILLIISNILYANSDKEYILEIKGLKYLDAKEIAKHVGAEDEGFLFSSSYTINKKSLSNLKKSIKNYLESQGFFSATIQIEKSSDKIVVYINENNPVIIKDIKINSDFDLDDIIDIKIGDIFVSDKFLALKEKINEKLLESGYCKYKLDAKAYIDIKKYIANIVIKLKKNNICRFGKITIEKHPKDIKKRVILSRIKYTEGEIFNIQKIKESYLSLNKLNTFANIKIAYDLERQSNIIDTNVSVDKRKKLRRYLVSFGVDSESGFRVKAQWEHRNFLGNAQKINIQTKLSKDEQLFEILFFSPALIDFYDRYFDFYIKSGYMRTVTNALEEKKFYINSYLNLLEGDLDLKVGLGLERLNIDLYEQIPSIIGGNFYLLYPYVDIIYDKRDSKIDPKNGYYLRAYFEYGLSSSEGGVHYIKYLLEGRYIKSFGDLTLAAVGKIGSIHEISGKLPASKLFLGGGAFSNRAYGKDKIGVITSSKSFLSIGGKSFLNLQLEANYKIYKKLYGAIFFDSTMISEDEYNFKGERIDTLGFGLRYKTPVGPVKIDIGFNIHNKKDYAILLMLGQSF